MKRPPLLGHWTIAAGFILAVWSIYFLVLYERNLRLELASVQGLISRLEREIDFFRSLVEPTRVATEARMREVHSLEDRIVSASESLVRVKSDGIERIELAKQERRDTEQQIHNDFDRLTDEVSVCNDWTTALKKNESALVVMGKKQSLMICLMAVGGLKGDISDARVQLGRTENTSKNLEVLTKQWRDKVTSCERELKESERQIKKLKMQLEQEGCSVGLFEEEVDT